MSIPKNIKKEHVILALKEIIKTDIMFDKQTQYSLLYEGIAYPSKDVISIANKYANPKEGKLDVGSFSAGHSDGHAFGFLRKLGFTIVKKDIQKIIKEIVETDSNIIELINAPEFVFIKQKEIFNEFDNISENVGFYNRVSELYNSEFADEKDKDAISEKLKENETVNEYNLIALIYQVAWAFVHSKKIPNITEKDVDGIISAGHLTPNKIFKSLIDYKITGKPSERNVENLIKYINNPSQVINCHSRNHQNSIYKLLLEKELQTDEFNEKVLKYVIACIPKNKIKNPDNMGTIIANVLYNKNIKRLWNPEPEKHKKNRYWLICGEPNTWTTYKNEINNKKEINFFINNFKGIESGQLGFVKMGGNKRGIYAKIEIVDVIGNPEIPLRKKKKFQKITFRVIENYLKKPFEISLFENNDNLKGKLKAGGSSIRLNLEEYEYIDNIIKGKPTDLVNIIGMKNTPSNFILYGPPGTGKTYKTVDIAACIIGGSREKIDTVEKIIDVDKINSIDEEQFHKNNTKVFNAGLKEEKIHFVTFHQNYSYEEFVGGLRPDEDNEDKLRFQWKPGIFIKACAKALELATINKPNEKEQKDLEKWFLDKCTQIEHTDFQDSNKYDFKSEKVVLIIDEINRANISRVFGELITLIEGDKRIGGRHQLILTLPNGDKKFGVPANLIIMGTMNTADKSLALLDVALRRRFEFKGLFPKEELIKKEYGEILKKLNEEIRNMKGVDYQIGHSYFMGKEEVETKDDFLKKVFNKNIIPLLNEYFMNDGTKVKRLVEKVVVINKKVFEHYGVVKCNGNLQKNMKSDNGSENPEGESSIDAN